VARIRLVTNAWLKAHQVRWVQVRFDVVAVVAVPGAPIVVQHYEAAF
jgi:putative endonuclease